MASTRSSWPTLPRRSPSIARRRSSTRALQCMARRHLSNIPSLARTLLGGRCTQLSGMRERPDECNTSQRFTLAAAGWPVAEIINKDLSSAVGLPSLLVDGRVPSILNGGLGAVNIAYWVAVLGAAVCEFTTRETRTRSPTLQPSACQGSDGNRTAAPPQPHSGVVATGTHSAPRARPARVVAATGTHSAPRAWPARVVATTGTHSAPRARPARTP
eukprot:953674-Prymnesium_polylepis.1